MILAPGLKRHKKPKFWLLNASRNVTCRIQRSTLPSDTSSSASIWTSFANTDVNELGGAAVILSVVNLNLIRNVSGGFFFATSFSDACNILVQTCLKSFWGIWCFARRSPTVLTCLVCDQGVASVGLCFWTVVGGENLSFEGDGD